MATLSLAKVWLVGRLVFDPELRATTTGKSVCTIRVAVNRPSGASFFSVACWDKKAEMVSKYFGKGDNICILGDLVSRTYQNSNGENATNYEISATDVKFVDAKNAGNEDYANPARSSFEKHPSPAKKQYTPGEFEEIPGDDDLPF